MSDFRDSKRCCGRANTHLWIIRLSAQQGVEGWGVGVGGSHPYRTLVSRVRGRHGHGAAAPLGHTGALQHAGVEACVAAGVFGQVVAPHEALVAQRAGEALLTCVRAVVARQLV